MLRYLPWRRHERCRRRSRALHSLYHDTQPRTMLQLHRYHSHHLTHIQALQSVLNAGARLIMRKRKYDHITSTLRDDLHWLPICQRILYKLSTIVYKCIHGAAPSYLTNLCVPVATNTSRRYLRSATHGDLQVPRTRTVTYGPRSFAVSGPTIWNTLPSTLRVSTTTLDSFRVD